MFPINDPSALGAISALESAGKLDQVTVVTVDGSVEGVKAIQAGKLLSTSAQFPKEIGRIAAEKMYEHLDGKAVDKEVKVRVELITADVADKFLEATEGPAGSAAPSRVGLARFHRDFSRACHGLERAR